MKTKIYFNSHPEYFVNEKKGVVVCKDYATIITSLPFANYDFGMITVQASAKCRPGEKFDVNRGMRIAKTRAENMIYAEAQKKLKKQIEECDKIKEEMSGFLEKSVEIVAHNDDYIDRLSFESRTDYIKNPEPLKKAFINIVKTNKD